MAAVTILIAFCACVYVAEYKEGKDETTDVQVLVDDPDIIYSQEAFDKAMKDGRLVEGRVVAKAEAPSGIIALRGKKISKADLIMGRRPSSAVSDSSKATVDAKPVLIGP